MVIDSHFERWDKAAYTPDFTPQKAGALLRKHRNTFVEAIGSVFEKLPLSKNQKNQLVRIAEFVLTKSIFPMDLSGIVFAGFGRQDVFPSVLTLEIECIVDNAIKYMKKDRLSGRIDHDNGALIIPFAQTEMVRTFMEGIDPQLLNVESEWLIEVFDKFPEMVAEKLLKASAAEARQLKNLSKSLLKDFFQKMREFRGRTYVQPVVEVVSVLPKDELATMAETLVNLTSFKRRISMDVESVSGPIDVAVISKSDGFVWINKKQYFKLDVSNAGSRG